MLKPIHSLNELRKRRLSLYHELAQSLGSMTMSSFERVVRQIHTINIKIHSFRGGLYDKE